jgi:hypothetical protein
MKSGFYLSPSQAAHLRKLVRDYKPKMGRSWKLRTDDQLWLRVLSQVVVAGNAAPGYTLQESTAVREKLGFSRLKKLTPRRRRKVIHSVLQAIGTRYVGKSAKNRKVDAALHNFNALADAGSPKRFFKNVAQEKSKEERIALLSRTLSYYKKKGCRDILIELCLATDCMALDQRIRRILESVGAKVPKSIDGHFEEIENALIQRVAEPSGLSGGELDRILFQNYGDIMVRLLCP